MELTFEWSLILEWGQNQGHSYWKLDFSSADRPRSPRLSQPVPSWALDATVRRQRSLRWSLI
eukprot:15194609-Heterocapsa_arctica.AAC.1